MPFHPCFPFFFSSPALFCNRLCQDACCLWVCLSFDAFARMRRVHTYARLSPSLRRSCISSGFPFLPFLPCQLFIFFFYGGSRTGEGEWKDALVSETGGDHFHIGRIGHYTPWKSFNYASSPRKPAFGLFGAILPWTYTIDYCSQEWHLTRLFQHRPPSTVTMFLQVSERGWRKRNPVELSYPLGSKNSCEMMSMNERKRKRDEKDRREKKRQGRGRSSL